MQFTQAVTEHRKPWIRLWQIAEALGITDGNFSRRLRRELSETDKERILHIIDNLAQGVTP